MVVANRVLLAIFFTVVTVPISSCGSHAENGLEESVVSPCVLASEPFRYSNRTIKLTGYITANKEGAYIWGDGCKNSGLVLHLGSALRQDANFGKALFEHGLSPTPIKATLVGRFRYTRGSSVRAFLFGVRTFEAERVLNLQVEPGETTETP